jgi:predicted DNA-binding protein (MmcQ/YjbR family)
MHRPLSLEPAPLPDRVTNRGLTWKDYKLAHQEGLVTIDSVREYCLSLPHAAESIQWGNDLVMKVGGKMFAVIVIEPAKVWISFKCSPEDFAELTERPGIIPAPYAARYHWVALETKDALSNSELKQRLSESHKFVFEGLPKKARAALR